jgi:hypothetical protein
LGFSDAVEQLGTASDAQEMHPQLLAALRQQTATALEHHPVAARTEERPQRKRLGRSLDQFRDPAPKAASTPAG